MARFAPLLSTLLATARALPLVLLLCAAIGCTPTPTSTPMPTRSPTSPARAPTNTSTQGPIYTVTSTQSPTYTPTPSCTSMFVAVGPVVNVRRAPADNSDIITTLPKGAEVKVDQRSTDSAGQKWCHVWSSSNPLREPGWIDCSLLSCTPVMPDKSSTPIPTPPLPPTPTPVGPCSGGSPGYTCNRCIKGNVSYTTGEKIYHLPNCPDYAATVINEAYGERWFSCEAEARAAGWRKARNCP